MMHSSTFRFVRLGCSALLASWCLLACGFATGAEIAIPRKQTKPPNKPYTPAEAISKMTVPEGFTVELCAAEPDVVNPVAMTFDERGRVWVTESFEYPRKAPGPGRDRVKILADADGDGTFETVKIFAEGLNIPSGIAVGHGGVWVANAPDILFYPDANRDDVADGPPQVVVTGFGRDDTHELPNSLTWGPDGYLYGLNGVFNHSVIKQNGRTFDFTCAMFRIDPRTREFSLFCEGTSNPWGIAFNENGDAFISACVIDHLWHLVETGYYHRQGGPYPPFTWKLGSIVDYKHQMAAYCGITWFDSDAYPEQYRKKLYMGNIHGGCINVDRVERNGATYNGYPEADFLTANDAWFMPVVQKVGPDGCLYILDWYDRYHCYQDANADPEGVDRAKGRLYRVRYQNTPRAAKFDLAKETDDQLIERLKSPNIFYREIAQRLLAERNDSTTRKKLQAIILDEQMPKASRLHALWSSLGGDRLDDQVLQSLFKSNVDEDLAAWAIRIAGNGRHLPGLTDATIIDLMYRDKFQKQAGNFQGTPPLVESTKISPVVALQSIITARKVFNLDAAGIAVEIAGRVGDRTVDQIAWQNVLPLLPSCDYAFLEKVAMASGFNKYTGAILPRTVEWFLAQDATAVQEIGRFLAWMATNSSGGNEEYLHTAECLQVVAKRLQSGELAGERAAVLRRELEPKLGTLITAEDAKQLHLDAAIVLGHWQHPNAVKLLTSTALDLSEPIDRRVAALDAWAGSRDAKLLAEVTRLLSSDSPSRLRFRVFDALTAYDGNEVATSVLDLYPRLDGDLKPAAVELLTSRTAWSNALLDAIATGTVPKDAVNVTQIAKLLKSGDKALTARVEQTWGKLRTERNPDREKVVADMRQLLGGSHGDAVRGQAVFMKLCGQCHKLHGMGQDVGPDITVNGRSSFEQLLNNVFDPSLVIGNAYQARTVVTADGRVLSGLLVEDNSQRVVLKLQGGKLETIARGDVEEMEISKLSLMPEGVEKQLQPQELIDLFALLKLDKSPTDPQAKPLPNFSELK